MCMVGVFKVCGLQREERDETKRVGCERTNHCMGRMVVSLMRDCRKRVLVLKRSSIGDCGWVGC